MNKKVGVNLEENRLEHSGSEVLEGDGAQERKIGRERQGADRGRAELKKTGGRE